MLFGAGHHENFFTGGEVLWRAGPAIALMKREDTAKVIDVKTKRFEPKVSPTYRSFLTLYYAQTQIEPWF